MNTDDAEILIQKRLEQQYAKVLKKIIAENKAFLKKMQDIASGKIKPPQFYVDTNQVDKWKQGFLQQELRKLQMVQRISEQLNQTGRGAASRIKDSLNSLYFGQYRETVKDIQTQCGKLGIRQTFSLVDWRSAKVAVNDYQQNSPFSKIAYRNLGQNDKIRRKLQSEMSQAILHGQSQRQVIKRIRRVVGDASYNAKRTAQTQGKRIRSQAMADAQHESAKKGIRIVNEWSCQMIPKTKFSSGSRDSHIYLNGKMQYEGQPFEIPAEQSDDGHADSLMFPGDPRGRACNVINCHCELFPKVLLDDQELVDGRIVKVDG